MLLGHNKSFDQNRECLAVVDGNRQYLEKRKWLEARRTISVKMVRRRRSSIRQQVRDARKSPAVLHGCQAKFFIPRYWGGSKLQLFVTYC